MIRALTFLCLALLSLSSFGESEAPVPYHTRLNLLQMSLTCERNILKVYESGSDFSLESVQNEMIPLSRLVGREFYHQDLRIPYRKLDNYTFYHYTDRNLNIPLEKLFKRYKKRDLRYCCGSSFQAGLFIANDPYTSKHFGNWRLVLEFNPKANVIMTTNDGDLLSPLSWDSALEEITSKYPRLKKVCTLENLKPLILQDSGVDLVHYEGTARNWLIVLNSRHIESSKFQKEYPAHN